MAHEFFSDLMDSYNRYAAWVVKGKENEDFGDSLEQELIQRAQNFFFNGDDINDSSIEFAIANSDLDVVIRGKNIAFSVPDSAEEDDDRIIQIPAP